MALSGQLFFMNDMADGEVEQLISMNEESFEQFH